MTEANKPAPPHLMNCQHSAEGWCLVCVGEQYAESEVLKASRDSLMAALQLVLNAHEKEAKATMSYQNARENFSDSLGERKAHERAMLTASAAEREARTLLLMLKA